MTAATPRVDPHRSADRGCLVAPAPQTPCVLAVDDDSFMRLVLQRTFLAAGMRVETFACASDLLASARLPTTAAVLLLDMQMPGMSGLELQRVLHERGVSLPVVFLTGSADIAMAVTAMRAGAFDFVEKPFDAADLVARVRHALAQGRPAPTDATADLRGEHARRRDRLTARERQVYERMVVGETSKQIANELGGSFRTIEIHRGRIMAKMEAVHMADLIRMSLLA